MIDLENYKRSIDWLDRGITELTRNPADEKIQDSVLLSFEVTYNLTESTLRRALQMTSDDQEAAYLSSCELMRYAVDYGITLTSGEQWLRYGLALEEVKNHQEYSSQVDTSLLHQYVTELRAFSERLGKGPVALV
jgi:hypothetical protein